MKLLQTKDYLFLIDEESRGIEFGEIGVNMRHSNLEPETRNIGGYGSDKFYWSHKKIIAYYPLNSEAEELDLPLLPVTPKDKWGVHEAHCCEKHGCKYGDNDCCVAIGIAKAKYSCEYCDDDENDKQFSLEDMRKCYEGVLQNVGTCIKREDLPTFNQYIQSLSTQQLPSEFIPEYINTNSFGSETNGYDSGNFIPKTITNPEGKEELQGTYKY